MRASGCGKGSKWMALSSLMACSCLRRACNAKTTDRTGFERLREEQFTVIAADLNVFIQSTGMVEEWKFTDFRPLPVLYWY